MPPEDLPDGATPRESPAVQEVLLALRETIEQDGRRVCLIAGADLAHVGPQFGDSAPVDAAFAKRVEEGGRAMLELIRRGDADGFYRQVVHEAPHLELPMLLRAGGGPRRVCGLAPVYALLSLLGPSEGRLLHYDQWVDARGAGSVTFGCVAFP